jgi:DNA-binding transcriptional MerR regulator
MEARTFTMRELCALLDMRERTVRYYIQLGLVPRPEGEARGARYTAEHLERLLRIRKLSGAGVSLEGIRQAMEEEGATPVPLHRPRPGDVAVRSHIHVRPGIEITVDPKETGISPERLRQFVNGIMELAASALDGDAEPTSPLTKENT